MRQNRGAHYIVVVDSDVSVASVLHSALITQVYEVDIAPNGEESIAMADARRPDLVILSYELPNSSGAMVCEYLKKTNSARPFPVIMISSGITEWYCLRSLGAGADDFLTKPISVPELLARVRAMLRRSPPGAIDEIARLGAFEIDRAARRVKFGGRPIDLSPIEYNLFDHFMRNPGRVFSREQLIGAVWSEDARIQSRNVDVRIRRLRMALRASGRGTIRTVRSSGYMFQPETQ